MSTNTITMTDSLKALNAFFNAAILSPEQFYSIGFTKREVTAQGRFSSKIAKVLLTCAEDDANAITDYSSGICSAGYVSINFSYLGIAFSITLTE